MRGDTLVAHYTQTDQVKAAITQGTLNAFVDGANQDASGQPPRYTFAGERVEDGSLKTIQFVTPGLLGWAVAMSAAFGAAATLQGWRNSKLLRRLQLSPVSAGSVVGARVVVTVLIALVQMAIFLGLGMSAFGLRLTGSWWMAVPLLVAGTLAFMSLGLLAGAIAKTQEGAVNLANFLVLPMAFLSGSFFPLDGAPGWLQVTSSLLPLRHLNDGMLDVMVRGQGPSAAFAPIGILLALRDGGDAGRRTPVPLGGGLGRGTPAHGDQQLVRPGPASPVLDGLGLVDLGDGEEHHEGEDHDQEDHAGDSRPEAESTVLLRLGHAVADGRAERAGQDVGQPEREHRVEPQEAVRGGDQGDDDRDERDGRPVADPHLLVRTGHPPTCPART